jgi:hypothetical protein
MQRADTFNIAELGIRRERVEKPCAWEPVHRCGWLQLCKGGYADALLPKYCWALPLAEELLTDYS